MTRVVAQIDKADRARRKEETGIDEDALSEAEQMFCAMAGNRGKKVFRNGWPDFIIEDKKTGKIVAVEVKSARDKLSVSQRRMFELLERLGVQVALWRPDRPGVLAPWRRLPKKKPWERPLPAPRVAAPGRIRPLRNP